MRVLRITPLWDWRAHPGVTGLTDAAEGVGGHAAQAVRITRALAGTGVEQAVIAPRAAGAPWRDELVPGVTVTGVGPAGVAGVHRRNLAWLAGVLAELLRRRGRYDVVHVHASGIVEPLWAALAAREVLRIPLVVTLHHSAQATYVAQSRRDAAVQVVTRAAERTVVRRSARTLTLTRRAAERIGGEPLPDCLDVDAFRSAAREAPGFRPAHGIPAEVPLALYAGRVSAEKGWRDLPGLLEAVDGLHVVVCGGGPELADLRATAGDRLHVTGAVAADTVAAAMGAADVLVLPSRFEELGSVLIEAMAVGLPGVAYDVGGTAEAIVPDVTGILVPRGDTARLAAAVRRVLDDDALRARALAEGPRIAGARFDVQVAAERLRALYAEVA